MDVVVTDVIDNATAAAGGSILDGSTLLFFDRRIFLTPGASANNKISSIKVFEPSANATFEARTSQMTEKISVYSFALKPEEHQPSGTCNFSRIDTAILELTGFGNTTVKGEIYAVNYNVLRIMSGMGGLAYSN